MAKKKTEMPIYHDSYMPKSLWCNNCPEHGVCGGMFAGNGHPSCMSFCRCQDIQSCRYVCRRNIRNFGLRSMEVQGFSLDNVPRCPVLAPPTLPPVVPVLYHGYRRQGRLRAPAVAVKLHSLFDHKTGRLKYNSREAVAAWFGFDPASRLIIVGVDDDPLIEPYWSAGRANKLYAALSAIKPDLVTVPNFSTFANVVRWDNLHGIKRIALSWSEFVLSGIPTSLHLNARTDKDWERWTEFIREREEVRSIALEFATGGAVARRGRYSVKKLLELAKAVPRDLQLVIEGGCKYLNELKQEFHDVVFLDTTSHMKSMKRKRFIYIPGQQEGWVANPTPRGQPIDALLQHNVTEVAKSIIYRSQTRIDSSTAKAVDRVAAGT